MDISNFTKASGVYLKADEVKKNPSAMFTITSEPILVDTEFEGKKQQKLQVEGFFNKESRRFDLSKTNARVCEQSMGSDTSKWIGKSLVLGLYQTMTSKGKLTDAILVKEVRIN